MKRPRAGKPISRINHNNTKDAHRHDSIFGGRMTSPSSIWIPFVKNVFWQTTSILRVIVVHAQESCACTRFLCMHKILVRAQESCACARLLCMHKIVVHAEESCACTRIPCMHKNLVHAHDVCACTGFLSIGFRESNRLKC